MVLSDRCLDVVRAQVREGAPPACTVLRSYLAPLGHVLLRRGTANEPILILHPQTPIPPDFDPRWLLYVFEGQRRAAPLNPHPARPSWSLEVLLLRRLIVRYLLPAVCPFGCVTEHGSDCPVGRVLRDQLQDAEGTLGRSDGSSGVDR